MLRFEVKSEPRRLNGAALSLTPASSHPAFAGLVYGNGAAIAHGLHWACGRSRRQFLGRFCLHRVTSEVDPFPLRSNASLLSSLPSQFASFLASPGRARDRKSRPSCRATTSTAACRSAPVRDGPAMNVAEIDQRAILAVRVAAAGQVRLGRHGAYQSWSAGRVQIVKVW